MAVYRKTENTIIVEPLIVWLFFQAVSHIAHKCQSFVNAIPQWQKQFLLSANVVPMHANWKQTSKERSFLSYELRNRPRSPWSLRGSVVEHRSAKSKGLRFDSSSGLRIFSLSHARDKTKNIFLYFFTKFKTYHLSYCYLQTPK